MNKFYAHYRDVPLNEWKWRHFHPREIACKGTGELLVDIEAMNALEAFRVAVGVPFSPNSAYRSEAHNKKVGGAKNSMHRKGKAFDIPISEKLTRDKIHTYAEKAGFTGFGNYNTFVHIDTGPKRKWDHRK